MSEHPVLGRIRTEAEAVIGRLKTERDELALKSHLLKAELKDEWEETESKWRYMEKRFDHFRDDASESAHEIGDAIKKVGEEISEAYRKMRNRPK